MGELLADLDVVGSVSAGTLEGDRMLRHAVERILSQLVELAVSVNGHVAATQLGRAPSDYRSSFDLVAEATVIPKDLAQQLRLTVGLRNVLTHEYAKVDLRLVATGVETARDQYAAYVRHVADWLIDR